MIEKPTFVFFGTSPLSIIVLLELEKAGLLPDLLVTTPDKPSGRKLAITPPMTKEWARARGIRCIQPENFKNVPDELTITPSGEKWDLFIVASYGKILPKRVFDLPKHGTLNVHPSLLPKLRGPSPIHGAIMNDDSEVGVTIMLLDEEMDHGPIVAKKHISLQEWPPTHDVLHDLLAGAGGSLLASTIPLWISGDITLKEQNHSKATYTKILKKEDGFIDLEDDPYKNYLKILAFGDKPGTHFFLTSGGHKMRLKIVKVDFKNGELEIVTVIPEGRKRMKYVDFKRSFKE